MKYLDLLRLKEETFEYFTEEESLEVVKENGYALRDVINQTEEMCLEVYKYDPDSIIYIRDTLEEY